MARTWKDNATEFGSLTRQGYGLRLAYLAACSVRKKGDPIIAGDNLKATQTEFAQMAGVAQSTVQASIAKWDRLADEGVVAQRPTLSPEDANRPVPDEWVEAYESLTENRPATRHLSLDKMAEAIKADPKIAKAALNAVMDSDHRDVPGVSAVNRPPQSPEGKAMSARVAATNAATGNIVLPIHDAATLLAKVERVWEDYISDIAPVELSEIANSLRECETLAATLRGRLALDIVTEVTR